MVGHIILSTINVLSSKLQYVQAISIAYCKAGRGGGRTALIQNRTKGNKNVLSSIRLLGYKHLQSQRASSACFTSTFGGIYYHKPRKRFPG